MYSVDSSMVRIRAFQARGPGSIPGRRMGYTVLLKSTIDVWAYGVMVSTLDSESNDPGSNPGRPIILIHYTRQQLLWRNG